MKGCGKSGAKGSKTVKSPGGYKGKRGGGDGRTRPAGKKYGK